MGLVKEAMELAGISEGDRVAEIGCGINISPALRLAGVCGAVYAIDKEEAHIRIYRDWLGDFQMYLYPPWNLYYYFSRRREKIHPIAADAQYLPFVNNSLDGVLFYGSMYSILRWDGSIESALESVHNCLKPGKYVISCDSTYLADRLKDYLESVGFLTTTHGKHRKIILGQKVLEKPYDEMHRLGELGVIQLAKELGLTERLGLNV